jgi:hypothetical protein
MPLAPTNLTPWGGQSIPAAANNIFTWQSDGTQAGYYIEYVRNTAGAAVQNTGWQSLSTSEHTFTAGTFTVTYEYKWRVKIRNVSGIESTFSDWAVFRAGAAAVLTITFPANDLDLVTGIPTYQHSYTHPDGHLQTAYQYQVYIGTTWDDFDDLTAAQQESYSYDELELLELGEAIWDSGRVESAVTSVEMPNGYFVSFEYWYKVRVTVWDSGGNQITSDLRTFQLIIDDIPEVPYVSAAADPDNGQIVISITNPIPDPGQVAAAYNRLYRRQPDGTWLLIADNITTSTASDKTFAANKEEEYAATAVGTNDIESTRSASVLQSCALKAYWITNPTTGDAVKISADLQWGRMQSERDREEYWGVDEAYPAVCYDARRFYRGPFKGALIKPEDGTAWPTYISQVRAVLDADDKSEALIFRSMFGDVLKVDVNELEIIPSDRFDQYREISFSMVEIVKSEPVSSYSYSTPPSTIKNFWVVDPETNTGMEISAGPQWSGLKAERDRAELVGFGSEMPAASYGAKKMIRSGFSGYLVAPDDGSVTPAELVKKFRELVDGKSKKPLYFKTYSGDRFQVDIYGFGFSLFDRFDNARQVFFEFVEVGEPPEPEPEAEIETYFLGPWFPAEFPA